MRKKKENNTALNFEVLTGGAGFCLYPSSQEVQWGRGCYPVLSHTLSVYLTQISPGTRSELG